MDGRTDQDQLAFAASQARARGGQLGSGGVMWGGVEQNRIKRAGTGVRALDPTRAFPGLTLFAPPGEVVYLIDLQGKVIHTWQMPYPARYGYLTERGTLLYNGWTPGDGWLDWQPYKG